VVGDGTWLTVGEAVQQMWPVKVSDQTIRRLADRGRLRSMRLPTDRRDRHILADDVARLREEMLTEAYGPPGPERDKALEALQPPTRDEPTPQ